MKIKKVILKNIKSFRGRCEFDFSNSSILNTISGINGSGKTTLFKSIILAQKVFFSEQTKNDKAYYKSLSLELINYFTSRDSEIFIAFEIDNSNHYPGFSIVCSKAKDGQIEWKLKCTEDDKKEILNFWNIDAPKKVIVYIDSNRYINEGDFTHEAVSLKTSIKENDLALDYIFYPDKVFASIYERIIRDYLRERVIPNKPRKDLPHVVSRTLIHYLLRYLRISNFTGLVKDNQFVLQIKPSGKLSGPYDVRNLSSGEKTIFYIIHFICYVNNIGMLIIDEPENNLHENLLADFVNLLRSICENQNFGDLVIKLSQANGEKIAENLKRQVKLYYSNHDLAQVFLLTHSKNLIYNNFSLGNNYVIDNELKKLDYDSSEEVLRSIGVSRIYSRVLFVEGTTENKLLETILASHNIKVRSLGNSHEVIETYKKYLKLKENIRDVHFCFMIDKDTKNDEEINALKSKDEKMFENHFVVLERHEIENYFLDPKIYNRLYKLHHSLFPELTAPSEQEIETKIKGIATKHKKKVVLKALQNLNQKSFSKLKLAVSGKDLPVESEKDYTLFIESAFTGRSFTETKLNIEKNFKVSRAYINNWDSDWIKLCDGKIVFKEYVQTLATEFKVQPSRLEKEIVQIATESGTFLAKSIVDSILSKFKN